MPNNTVSMPRRFGLPLSAVLAAFPTGPSFTVDTACSSTMTALNQAMLALRSGQCEAAIVGGSTLTLKPTTSLNFFRLGMLSPDGKCKAFDSDGECLFIADMC